MRKLIYISLESYNARYTLQLTDWNTKVFKEREIDYVIVDGETIDDSQSIQVGQVLDAHGRSYYSLSQMMKLTQMFKNGEITGDDVIFFEDMFTPGIESLPYIMDQIPKKDRPAIWVRCLAQTIDPDDFVHVWDMTRWMKHYENMVNNFVTGVLASNEEMVAHMKIAGWTAPLYNISGLAFDAEEVRSRVNNKIKPFSSRTNDVIFASRFDQEKNPGFFLDLVEMTNKKHPEITFTIAQGGVLRSNNPKYVRRARDYARKGLLNIKENLSKNEYYALMNNSKVLKNSASQDWTSNVISEADALGTNVLFPAYRSFPEILANDRDRMYIPWSLPDAYKKLKYLIKHPSKEIGKISNWTSGTVGRCIDIMEGKGEKWNRDSKQYREHLITPKYK